MHSTDPPSPPTCRLGDGGAFVAASLSFVFECTAGATRKLLYRRYRAGNRVVTNGSSMAAVGYFVCAVLALLVFGCVSDHVGPEPVTVAALSAAVLGGAVFLTVDGPASLLTGQSF